MTFFGRSKPKPVTRGLIKSSLYHSPARAGVSRVYEVAKYDRHTEGWFGDYGVSQWDIMGQLQIVRNRSREMAKNDPYLHKIVEQRRNNIIGAEGFRLMMDVCDWAMIRGDDGQKHYGKTPDAMANGIIQRAWKLWAETPEWCDVKGRKTLATLLALCDADYVREGESIVEMVPGAQGNESPFNFSLRRIRPDALAILFSSELSNGNMIYNGVEVDPMGRCAGYWFHSQMMPTGIWSGTKYRVSADLICHRYDEDYEDQHRGFPMIACILRTVKMLHQYNEAELIKARRQAYSSGTYHVDPNWPGADPDDIADPSTDKDRGQFQQNIEPGEDRICAKGWLYDQPAPTAPNPNQPLFNQSMLRQIASGSGSAYHNLANDFGSINWSAGRLAEAEQREGWKVEQQAIIDAVLRPVFRRDRGWLAMWLASGKAPLPFSKIERFRGSDVWRGHRWPLADPSNEVPLMETAVRRGWASDEDYAAEMPYGTFAENVEKTRENDRVAKGTAVADRNAPKAGAAAPIKQEANENKQSSADKETP
jgi:lambda family phage portal protein